MGRVPGPIGTYANSPRGGPLGYEEYFAQLRDGSLWYFKIKLYGECRMMLGSDRLNSSPGGLVYNNLSFQVVQQIPLDEYEKQIQELCARSRMFFSPAYSEKPLEESDIIFDAVLCICTLGASAAREALITNAISVASLLFDAFITGESGGLGGAVTDGFLKYLYTVLLCNKIVNVKKGSWTIDLLAAGTGKVGHFLPPAAAKEKAKNADSREERLLRLIVAFRHQVDEAKFKERYQQQYKEALRILEQK